MSCIIYFVLVHPCFLSQQMFLAIEECRNQKCIGEQPCKRRGKTDDDVAEDRHQQEADHDRERTIKQVELFKCFGRDWYVFTDEEEERIIKKLQKWK